MRFYSAKSPGVPAGPVHRTCPVFSASPMPGKSPVSRICDSIGGWRSWQNGDCRGSDDWCFTSPGEKAAHALTETRELDVVVIVTVLTDGVEHAR